jgi:hypothetical protein
MAERDTIAKKRPVTATGGDSAMEGGLGEIHPPPPVSRHYPYSSQHQQMSYRYPPYHGMYPNYPPYPVRGSPPAFVSSTVVPEPRRTYPPTAYYPEARPPPGMYPQTHSHQYVTPESARPSPSSALALRSPPSTLRRLPARGTLTTKTASSAEKKGACSADR